MSHSPKPEVTAFRNQNEKTQDSITCCSERHASPEMKPPSQTIQLQRTRNLRVEHHE